MFKLFMANKYRLGVNYTKFFKRTQATIVSYSANVTQVFKLGMFSSGFTEKHYSLVIFIGIFNTMLIRVRNSGQDVALEYIAPFFCLPMFFFSKKYRTAFTNNLLSSSSTKYSLWFSSVYSNTAIYQSSCFTKVINYFDYSFRFIIE
jgi:hypothetical protein